MVFGPDSFLVLQRLFSLLWICISSYHFLKIPTSRPYVLSTWILRAVQIQLVFYSGSLRFLLTQILSTCWGEADILIFSRSSYGKPVDCYPCGQSTALLEKSLVLLPLQLNPRRHHALVKQHVRLFFGAGLEGGERFVILLLGDNLPRQLGSRVQDNRFQSQSKRGLFWGRSRVLPRPPRRVTKKGSAPYEW